MSKKKPKKSTAKPRGRARSALPDVDSPNEFAVWIAEEELSIVQISRILSVSSATVYGWRRGNRPPSRKMAGRISKMTDGQVSVESWDV